MVSGFMAGGAGEPGAQADAEAREAGFDGFGRGAQGRGHFGDGLAGSVAGIKECALSGRELREARGEESVARIWRGVAGRGLIRQTPEQCGVAAAAAGEVDETAAGDLREPAPHRLVALEAPDMADAFHVGGLECLAGGVFVAVGGGEEVAQEPVKGLRKLRPRRISPATSRANAPLVCAGDQQQRRAGQS